MRESSPLEMCSSGWNQFFHRYNNLLTSRITS
jgi:hypothetical protein